MNASYYTTRNKTNLLKVGGGSYRLDDKGNWEEDGEILGSINGGNLWIDNVTKDEAKAEFMRLFPGKPWVD